MAIRSEVWAQPRLGVGALRRCARLARTTTTPGRAARRRWLCALVCVVAAACNDAGGEHGEPLDASVNPPDASHADEPRLEIDSEIVCSLLGKDGHNPAALQPQLRIYGTDMGIPVVIGERMYLLFGDTWTRPVCEGTDEPYQSLGSDDVLGSLPLQPAPDPDACLEIEFPTWPGDESKYLPITLEHGGQPVDLLALGVASAAFTYRDELYALFNPFHDVECRSDADCNAPAVCALSVCAYRQLPVFPTRILGKSGTSEGRPSSAFSGFAELSDVNFSSVTMHTVNHLAAGGAGSDYANDAPNELLVFGRYHYFAGLDDRGVAQPPELFLFRQSLAALSEQQRFSPQYFAGLDAGGAPRWSDDAARAQPVASARSEVAALDGQDQPVPILFTGNMSISTIPPFGAHGYRWLLAYGGRSPVGVDAYATDTDPRLGLFFRLARDPWGPWTAPRRLWSAYSPEGPSIVYRPDWDGVPSDEGRGPRTCDAEMPYEDLGVEYSPQVIERFSRVDGDTLTIHWLMSIWNPYRVIQMKSEITLDE